MKLALALALLSGCNATLSFEETRDSGVDAPVDDVETDVAAPSCTTIGCPLESLRCDPDTGRCEECVLDGDCNYPLTRCDPATHKCWSCLNEYDCPDDSTCVLPARRCVLSCPGYTACKPGWACDATRGICASCASNKDCFDPHRPVCQPDIRRCEECLDDEQCPTTHPRCNPATFRCVACLSSTDCVAPKLCYSSRHWCVTPP